MREVILYGAAYSVYSRIARLALLEKGVEHRFVELDIFEPNSVLASYQRRQPFGKIPALSHGEFELYEASAITRYVDEAFSGPALQPPTHLLVEVGWRRSSASWILTPTDRWSGTFSSSDYAGR